MKGSRFGPGEPLVNAPHRIDLNADLGEGFGDDLALLEVVTSANVACGFHAGGPSIMRQVTADALKRGVCVGAQVSYRDLEGFGRRDMEIDPADLAADVRYQIGALSAFGEVAYVKPHGALYNRAMRDAAHASAVVEAILSLRWRLPVVALPGSELARLAAAAGLGVVAEGYADRRMTPEGRLVPRSEPGAVITEAGAAAEQAVALARSGKVRTICVHGDTPGAIAIARRVRDALEDAGIDVEPFA